jgi:hypothetical protein
MEREVRLWLWGAVLFGGLFAGALGLLAGDPGMVKGAVVATIGGMAIAPFVARTWR